MPAFSVDLSVDMKAGMGDFIAAARDMEREWNDIQRRITKDLRSGQNAKPEDVERAQHLEEKRDYYLQRERDNRNAKQQREDDPNTYLAHDLAPSARRSGSNGPDAEYIRTVGGIQGREDRKRASFDADWDSARQENGMRTMNRMIEELQESRTPGGIKTLASLLNTHNPHGSIRAIAQGRISGSMVSTLGESIKGWGESNGSEMATKFGGQIAAAGVAVAPIAMLAYLGGKALAAGLEEHEAHNLAAQEAGLVMASNSFEMAHKARFDPSGQMTDYLAQRTRDIASRANAIDAAQPSWTAGDTVLTGMSGGVYGLLKGGSMFLDSGQHAAEMKKGQQNLYDMALGPGSKLRAIKNIEQQADFHNYMNSEMVARKFSWKESAGNGGLFGYAWSNTWGRLTGSRQREQENYAMELATRQIKGLEERLKKEVEDYNADPHNKLNDRERDHHMHIVEEAHVKHFQNWSPI